MPEPYLSPYLGWARVLDGVRLDLEAVVERCQLFLLRFLLLLQRRELQFFPG